MKKEEKAGFTPLEIRRPKRLPTRPPEAGRGGSLTGFTLIELMIVISIIGILASITVPNFIKAREESQKTACIANMKGIQAAAERFALEAAIHSGTISTAALVPDYVQSWPRCGTAEYAAPVLDSTPTCPNALPGHIFE